MGRDRKNEKRVEHWTQMVRSVLQTPAWRALSCTAQALYPWLRFEWHGKEYNNNGKIMLSVRQAADRLGVSVNTAAKAFQELQAKGFIHVTKVARLGIDGNAKGTAYEITELPMKGEVAGRMLFRDWHEGADYPVVKAASRGNCRASQKTKPCLKNCDSPVSNIATFLKKRGQ